MASDLQDASSTSFWQPQKRRQRAPELDSGTGIFASAATPSPCEDLSRCRPAPDKCPELPHTWQH